MSCGPAGFHCCRLLLHLDWAKAQSFQGAFFVAIFSLLLLNVEADTTILWLKNTKPVHAILCSASLSCPVLCVTRVSHLHHRRLEAAIYILMETVPEFMFTMSWNHYFCCRMEMVFVNLVDIQIHEFLLFLIGAYKYALFRTVNKEAGHLYCMRCFALVFFDDQNMEKLPLSYSLRAEEGTMSCWYAFSSSLPASLCLCITSLFLSFPIAFTHSLCFTVLLVRSPMYLWSTGIYFF